MILFLPDKILEREEYNNKVVDEINDVGQQLILHDTLSILLQLLRGADDEGDGGDEDHGEGEESEELSQLAGPGILNSVPQPRSPSSINQRIKNLFIK